MPYDSRTGATQLVSSYHHRQRSRRRIAAVSFLSNISLDGTHNDTNLHFVSSKLFRRSLIEDGNLISNQLANCGEVAAKEEPAKGPVRKVAVAGKPGPFTDCFVGKHHRCSDAREVDAKKFLEKQGLEKQNVNIVINRVYNPNIHSTFELFDDRVFVQPTAKKSLTSTGPEKQSYAKNVFNKVKSLRTRTVSATSSYTASGCVKSQNDKENAFPSGIKERNRKISVSRLEQQSSGGSLESEVPLQESYSNALTLRGTTCESSNALLTGSGGHSMVPGGPSDGSGKEVKYLKGAPFHSTLASAPALACVVAADPANSRKRTSSGSRHLAPIADMGDSTIDLTSHHTPPSGTTYRHQEISYSYLLVSSPYFGTGKQRCHTDALYSKAPSHIAVSRCFSHDPNMHQQHQTDAIRHSHPQVHTTSMCQSMSCTSGNLYALALPNYSHAPELLDDPYLRAGKHRKLLHAPSYMATFISYAKPDDLKKELNENFRKKFPHVKITLSKLRSLKREMVHICQVAFPSSDCKTCALTISHAHAYFDSLCLNGKVEKCSRKPLAGACLMISAKINDVKGAELRGLVEKIENQFRLDRSDLVSSEITALLLLQFTIHLPIPHVNIHYQRLLFEH